MRANKPACVAPGGACFRPETGGQRCKPQRQRGPVHYLLADEVGERHFRRRDKPAAVGGAEQIVGELRKLAGAEHRLVAHQQRRSEEHTSELQSLMRISYAVFCLKKTNSGTIEQIHSTTTYSPLNTEYLAYRHTLRTTVYKTYQQ